SNPSGPGHSHLDNVGVVSSEHNHLAGCHVEDSHHTKRNCESNGNQYDQRPMTNSKKKCFDSRIERAPPTDELHRSRSGMPHTFIALHKATVGRFLAQSLQFVKRILTESYA